MFKQRTAELFDEIGEAKKMVLSTSFNDNVTSRMMSIIVMDGEFYFQTDKTFRKYEQLKNNSKAALCTDNIQVEGVCECLGSPLENEAFCELYKKHFYFSYEQYTSLENEILFSLKPIYIKKWIYENGNPYEEEFDFVNETYEKKAYVGK